MRVTNTKFVDRAAGDPPSENERQLIGVSMVRFDFGVLGLPRWWLRIWAWGVAVSPASGGPPVRCRRRRVSTRCSRARSCGLTSMSSTHTAVSSPSRSPVPTATVSRSASSLAVRAVIVNSFSLRNRGSPWDYLILLRLGAVRRSGWSGALPVSIAGLAADFRPW